MFEVAHKVHTAAQYYREEVVFTGSLHQCECFIASTDEEEGYYLVGGID